jgi:signal transduction histidine kinase
VVDVTIDSGVVAYGKKSWGADLTGLANLSGLPQNAAILLSLVTIPLYVKIPVSSKVWLTEQSLCNRISAMSNDQQIRDSQQARLAALYQISSQLGASPDLSQAVEQALDTIIELTGAESGCLMLIDEENGRFTTIATHSADPEAFEDQMRQIGSAVVEPVMASGESLLINDAQKDGRFSGQQTVVGGELRSIMCAPLWSQGKVTGAVYVEKRLSGSRFEQADLNLLSAFANQAALVVANGRLQEAVRAANRARHDFISLVTHELRLPMTSIKGYADLLTSGMAGELNAQQQQFFTVIQRNLERMGLLIGDLADINRVESGRMKFDSRLVDLRPLVEKVVANLTEAVNGRNQTITIALPDDLPQVYADPTRLVQILANLVSNAHKYTADGGQIHIEAQSVMDMVRVDVTDNGLGISEEDQTRLFTPFFRAEDRAVREQLGWGLGLAVARKFVEAQRGTISFASELGAGSTFSFTIPTSPPVGPPVGPPPTNLV